MGAVENIITDNLPLWSSSVQLKSTRGRGSSSKRNLYGIKKLRELILDLAVRGLLVPQDPNDEPASVLLENILAEKKLRGSSKKGRTKNINSKVLDDIDIGHTPDGWIVTSISEIAEIQPKNDIEGECDASFVEMASISTNYDGSHEQQKRKWSKIKKGYTHIKNGDIGLAKVTPCFENSKAAIFDNLINGFGAATTELHVARLAGEFLNTRFILFHLKSANFLTIGKTKMTGTSGLKRVPKDFFARYPITLAPLAEQHRIVTKVDELMALCDTLEQQQENSIEAHETLVETLFSALTNAPDAEAFQSAWERVSKHFDTLLTTERSVDKLKETILQLAIMGKLVPQDPNDEPASVLLKKIASEKERLIKDGEIKKKNNSLETNNIDPFFKIPNNWKMVNLGKITAITGGKRVSKGYKLKLEPTPFIYIRVTDMKNGTIDDSNLHYIGAEEREKIKSYIVHEDDIYMTIVGATIGKCGIVPSKFDNMNLTENAARIKVISGVNNKFLYLTLRGEYCQNQFHQKTNKVGVEKMALSRLESTKIPLPPLAEQHRIVAKVDELMALCDDLKQSLNEAQTTQMQLTDAVVENAF